MRACLGLQKSCNRDCLEERRLWLFDYGHYGEVFLLFATEIIISTTSTASSECLLIFSKRYNKNVFHQEMHWTIISPCHKSKNDIDHINFSKAINSINHVALRGSFPNLRINGNSLVRSVNDFNQQIHHKPNPAVANHQRYALTPNFFSVLLSTILNLTNTFPDFGELQDKR